MAFAVSCNTEQVAECVVRHEEDLNWVVVRVKPLVLAVFQYAITALRRWQVGDVYARNVGDIANHATGNGAV